MSPALKVDLEVYTDTGTVPAQRAAAWVKKNMRPETVAAMNAAKRHHRPLDYEARSQSQDDIKAAQARLDTAESDQFGVSPRPLSENGAPLHPRVVEYLRRGDLLGALRNLRITSPDKYVGRLADKMRASLADTKVQVVSEATMARIEAVLRPGRTPDPRGAVMGVYTPTVTPEAITSAQRQGRDEAVSLVQQ